MITRFDLRPGERLNEVHLSQALGVSRTPVREALSRLCAEQFLLFKPNLGFFVKAVDRAELASLFELRLIVEVGGIELAVARADPAGIDALSASWAEALAQMPSADPEAMFEADKLFHTGLAALSGNLALTGLDADLNDRLRFARWVYLNGRSDRAGGRPCRHSGCLARPVRPALCRAAGRAHPARGRDPGRLCLRRLPAPVHVAAGLTRPERNLPCPRLCLQPANRR